MNKDKDFRADCGLEDISKSLMVIFDELQVYTLEDSIRMNNRLSLNIDSN